MENLKGKILYNSQVESLPLKVEVDTTKYKTLLLITNKGVSILSRNISNSFGYTTTYMTGGGDIVSGTIIQFNATDSYISIDNFIGKTTGLTVLIKGVSI